MQNFDSLYRFIPVTVILLPPLALFDIPAEVRKFVAYSDQMQSRIYYVGHICKQMLTAASAACIYSSVGGAHFIIILQRRKEKKKSRKHKKVRFSTGPIHCYKGAVDSPSGINTMCCCTERKK